MHTGGFSDSDDLAAGNGDIAFGGDRRHGVFSPDFTAEDCNIPSVRIRTRICARF